MNIDVEGRELRILAEVTSVSSEHRVETAAMPANEIDEERPMPGMKRKISRHTLELNCGEHGVLTVPTLHENIGQLL